ncbi:hypothetical protein DO021_12460 [Desulfobacter hydrogenophilus]|uniref:Uncharacterized protein n=1 Tax=Desulfobacter hydrogenophilus TaxID=2291 RepID=A0A328FAR2_9BACT|nr:hypothetical protein [Desulfobacter hydrogenophilus]NDY72476.1 hypothetical protein [Desulfobacter hydrogenophilus]QBH13795.1 hypothetical protein EYB58_13205 [Desulfobacter hydrogenophilus]RAM01741.1 hypothetical protein DO021_12460 [Desulfobacter hydrogenophilus]
MNDFFFKNINIGGISHLFVCKGDSRIASREMLDDSFLFKRQLHANLYKVDDYILKVCYGQSIPKDIFRKYALKSQAERESKSAAILSELGLVTPKTYFSAFSLFPKMRKGVESMHEMDFLSGYDDLNPKFVHRPDCLGIIQCFGRDLAVMLNAMLYPKDLGLGNIMYHPVEGKLAWIDSDLRHFKDKETLSRSVMRKLNHRFLKHLNNCQSDIFWRSFCENSTLFAEKGELLSYREIDYKSNQ